MKSTELLYIWIGNRIAHFRKQNNLSQTTLAELMGLSRGSIANIEKGRQQAPLHVLWGIAKQLDTSIDQLLPRKDEHISQDTNELINHVNKMDELLEDDKKLLSRFVENNY